MKLLQTIKNKITDKKYFSQKQKFLIVFVTVVFVVGFFAGFHEIIYKPIDVLAATPLNGRTDFVTDHDPHTYWELNTTNLGTNYGDDTSGNDDNTAVVAGDISTSGGYQGMNNQNDPPQDGWLDIYTVTDAAMLVYIPAGLSHGTNYGLFHNGGGTNAQGAFLRATSTGVELACAHNAGGDTGDYLVEEIPDASLPGWFAFSCQYSSYGGTQGDMALWLDGVAERSGTRTYQLTYGPGNPNFGNNGGIEPNAAEVLDPSSYTNGDWGGNTAIDSSGILIANFAADNLNQTNTTPPGNGDTWHQDYYADHNDTSAPTPNPPYFDTAPYATSSDSVSATSTTLTDASTPVEYYFTATSSGCTANHEGTGGTDSGWQTSEEYTDSGLQANKCYGYLLTARDSASSPNYTSTSTASTTYTLATVPSAPTVNTPQLTSLTITNNENGNPTTNPTTEFAVRVNNSNPNDTTWENKWVDASGNPSVSEVWLTDAQLTNLVVQGLTTDTYYEFDSKARNEDNIETALGPVGSGTPTAFTCGVQLLDGIRLFQ